MLHCFHCGVEPESFAKSSNNFKTLVNIPYPSTYCAEGAIFFKKNGAKMVQQAQNCHRGLPIFRIFQTGVWLPKNPAGGQPKLKCQPGVTLWYGWAAKGAHHMLTPPTALYASHTTFLDVVSFLFTSDNYFVVGRHLSRRGRISAHTFFPDELRLWLFEQVRLSFDSYERVSTYLTWLLNLSCQSAA